ncbi:hypothetical protein PIIN_08342 [Serendipita indica DSM 11827]|uniref:Uncharacterized protein n=1 Tax=Serendipita indica (strain DSM 11827) TaxID=1109443 RepID=G4TSU3_SERID|nr:hypothetical protein PIIN_08342 [Serendipita indica DSM 11827]
MRLKPALEGAVYMFPSREPIKCQVHSRLEGEESWLCSPYDHHCGFVFRYSEFNTPTSKLMVDFRERSEENSRGRSASMGWVVSRGQVVRTIQ